MKKIKSFVLALALIMMVGSAVASVACFVQGNSEQGTELVAMSLLGYGLANFQVVPMAGFSLGLTFSRTEETLIQFLRGGRVDEATFAKYTSGQLRFRDYGLYRSIQIDGFSGIQKIWDVTIAKAAGVCNVDRARLDKDVTICIDTILIGYANSGGAGTNPAALAGYDHVVTAWPAGLVNGEITILQDGNPILEDFPTRLCGSMADSTFGVGRAEGYLLKNPLILEGDKPFEVRINFPDAIAPANTDFLRLDLLGVGTRKRGMI